MNLSAGSRLVFLEDRPQDRPGSIPANRLEPDSLTGTQIEEGSLTTVPAPSSERSAEGR
jgi:hypothetical protein